VEIHGDKYKYDTDQIKINDVIKNNYCENNNIPLIRLTSTLTIDTILTKILKK
jgi:hypothetical protein